MIKKYYENNRIYNFRAKITSITELESGYFNITLDSTYFYPEGGGQPADRGYIDNIEVVDVQKSDNNVIHTLASKPSGLIEVECQINKEHRDYFMIQHTGQHLISAVLKHELDIDTLSVHFGEEYTTIEINRENISDTELDVIENRVYELITNNNRVIYHETDDEGLKNFNIRRESKFTGYIRVVEIVGYDSVPCGGVHLGNLCEIGIVKITGYEKIRGHIRLTILIGLKAYKDYQKKNRITAHLNRELSTTTDSILDGVDRLKQNINDLKLEKKSIIDSYSKKLIDTIVSQEDKTYKFDNLPKELLQKVATKLVMKLNRPVLLLNITELGVQWVLIDSKSSTINFNEFRSELLPIISGKGGGKKDIWQGSAEKDNVDKFIENFNRWCIK